MTTVQDRTEDRPTGDTTKLSLQVSGVPWRTEFELGKGIDALTGKLADTAIVADSGALETSKASSGSWSSHVIKTVDDMEQMASVSVKGSYNETGLEVSGSLSYLNNVKISQTSVSYVGIYTLNASGYSTLKNPRLTDQAAKVLTGPNGLTEFADLYGHYYIAGYASICSLIVIYHCSASSKDSRDKFEASVSANMDGLFSGTAEGAYSSARSSNNVDVNIEVIPMGANVANTSDPMPTPTKPEDVPAVLTWFEKNLTAEKTAAQLQHYSQIDTNIPPHLPIDPDVFVSLTELRYRIAVIGTLHQIALDFDRDRELDAEYATFIADVDAQQGSVVANNDRRLKLIDQAQGLYEKLGNLVDKHDFMQAVRAAASAEDRYREWTYVSDAAYSWSFGYNVGWNVPESVRKDIHELSQDYVKESDGPQYQYNTFSLNDPTKTIVGWRITSNWHDDTGGSWQIPVQTAILGSQSAYVHVASDWWRGCNWTFTAYVVDTQAYSFADGK